MPVTIERLKETFRVDPSRGDYASFEFDKGIQRFVGDLVSHSFRGVSVPERQNWVWDELRKAFGEDAKEVSLILTYTPEEWEEVGDQRAS